MTRANKFRKNALTSGQFAKDATDTEARTTWLSIAEQWERLALEADRNPDIFIAGDGV